MIAMPSWERMKKTALVLIVLVVIGLGVLLSVSIMRKDRMLDKYESYVNFDAVRETFVANLGFVRENPRNDSAYYSLGQGFYGLQGYDDAIWAMEKAIEISPDNYYYWAFLGKIYQAQKDYVSASEAYAKALELEPDKPLNYTTLAWLYYFRMELMKDRAYEILKGGLEKFPNDKTILFDITRYCLYDENKTEFLKYAPLYIKVDSTNDLINKTYKEWKKQ